MAKSKPKAKAAKKSVKKTTKKSSAKKKSPSATKKATKKKATKQTTPTKTKAKAATKKRPVSRKTEKFAGKNGLGKAGAKAAELQKVAGKSAKLSTTASIKLASGYLAELELACYGDEEASGSATLKNGWQTLDFMPLTNALNELVQLSGGGELQPATVKVKFSKCPLKAKDLKLLALAAWSEAFASENVSETELAKQQKKLKQKQNDQKNELVDLLRGGSRGVKKWNEVTSKAVTTTDRKKLGSFRKLDLSSAQLKGASLYHLDWQGTNFTGANLSKTELRFGDFQRATFREANLQQARLIYAKCADVDFTGADLSQADLSHSGFRRANFAGAKLTGTKWAKADLTGADLSAADLSGVTFGGKDKKERTTYDQTTKLPKDFVHQDGMHWKGKGHPPGAVKALKASRPTGPIDMDVFMERLKQHVDASRYAKALSMLQADSFQLFADVTDDHLVGVVKSQTDAELVYSCRLTSEGKFACCTQNLNPCGGLRGKLCKHLLVLIIGLTKGKQIDPETVDQWVDITQLSTPELDKDVMSETLLRYKGAEAGEVDWRPTETVPEDFIGF